MNKTSSVRGDWVLTKVHLGTGDPCRSHATASWACLLRSLIQPLSSSSSSSYCASYLPVLSINLFLLLLLLLLQLLRSLIKLSPPPAPPPTVNPESRGLTFVMPSGAVLEGRPPSPSNPRALACLVL